MIKNNKLWSSIGLFVLTIAFSASVHSASMDPVDIELGDIAAGEFLLSQHHDAGVWFGENLIFTIDQPSTVSVSVTDIQFANSSGAVNNFLVAFGDERGVEGDVLVRTLDAGTFSFYVSSDVSDQSDIYYFASIDVQPVPLPAAAVLFVSSLFGLFGLRRRSLAAQ